jgi:hypothetical protein
MYVFIAHDNNHKNLSIQSVPNPTKLIVVKFSHIIENPGKSVEIHLVKNSKDTNIHNLESFYNLIVAPKAQEC